MNKIAIVLSPNGNNYVLKHVRELDDKNCENVVLISGSDYGKLVRGENTNIKCLDFVDGKDIYLSFDEETLAKQSSDKAKDPKIAALDTLKNITLNISNIKVEKVRDIASINISCSKREKKDINLDEIDPSSIIDTIKNKVVAQDLTVKTIVENIYNNQRVISCGDQNIIDTQKTNILLDGPTGTGKTLIMKEVAHQMSLPIVIKSSTKYATTGYKGESLQEMLISLLEATDGDIDMAQRGIIVLDEFDKLGNADKDKSLEMREAVQEDLLTYLSGTTFKVEYKGKSYDFDTSQVTFICLGAFTDLREKKSIELDSNGNYSIEPEDYISAGIKRELVGRFQLITSTRELKVGDLIKILEESEISPLRQLVELGKKVYKTNIVYDDSIIEKIAQQAYDTNTGARALGTVVNGIRSLILGDLEKNLRSGNNKDIVISDDMLEKIKAGYVREGRGK